MKYKIINTRNAPPKAAAVRRAARRTHEARQSRALMEESLTALPIEQRSQRTPADISELFGFGGFYDPLADAQPELYADSDRKHRKTARHRAFIWRAKALAAREKETIVSKCEEMRRRREARKEKRATLPMLLGALCAVLCVFALSVGVMGYRLLLKDRLVRSTKVEIPELIGESYDGAAFDGTLFEVSVNYEYDSDTPSGTVIAQTPMAGAVRRVYRGGEPCKLTLTVSLGERVLTMRDYISCPEREALLELKNESLKYEIEEKYSDTVPLGHIISTTPAAGESFSADEVVTLTVSLGKERKYAAVPQLLGLTEVRAAEVLRALGFDVGEIKYVASQSPIGTVISQGVTAYSLLEIGAQVDLQISAGTAFSEKTVPDLYGLTPDEAKDRLADVGLVCGNVYIVQSGGGVATVVSQSVPKGTPITAGMVSVDIYVTS